MKRSNRFNKSKILINFTKTSFQPHRAPSVSPAFAIDTHFHLSPNTHRKRKSPSSSCSSRSPQSKCFITRKVVVGGKRHRKPSSTSRKPIRHFDGSVLLWRSVEAVVLPSPGVVNGDGSSATPRELIYLHVQKKKKNQAKEKYIKFACQDKGIEFAKKESALSTSHVPQRATPPFTMVEETEKVVATWFGPVCSPSASRPSPCANTGPRRRRWMVLVSFLRCPKGSQSDSMMKR